MVNCSQKEQGEYDLQYIPEFENFIFRQLFTVRVSIKDRLENTIFLQYYKSVI